MPFINIFDTGGINQSLPHTKINRNECTQLDNFIHSYTATNASELISFMQKAPSEQNYLNDLGSYSGLGLYQFKSYDGQSLHTVGVFSDGKIYTAGSTTWTPTLVSGLSTTSSVNFAHYYRKETKDTVCIMANGSDAMMKWNTEDATVSYTYNKGGEGSATLTGTVKFTRDSDQVVGVGTNFYGVNAQLQAGDFIRVGEYEMRLGWYPNKFFFDFPEWKRIQRIAVWYEVKSIESETALTLEKAFSADTVTSGSGAAQRKAQPLSGQPAFVKGNANVTVATDLTAEYTAGQHIRPNAKSRWYEVESVSYTDPTTTIVLRNVFAEDSITSAVKGCQRSLVMNNWGYVKLFEAKGIQKMIYGYDVTGSDYGAWKHSEPGDPEDVPSLNQGRIPGMMTGIFQIGNYLGFFTETNYYIYKYTAADDDFKRIGTGVQGCTASASIQEMPGGVIFLSTAGLYKLSIQEGLESIGDKVQLELSLASVAGADLPTRGWQSG